MPEEIVFKNKENKYTYELLSKFVMLRTKAERTKGAGKEKAKREYKEHFNFLIKRFSYIPEIHTRRYIRFANYPDLLQEGLLGLIMALDKFDMDRSNNFFQLANWYVKTRVKRSANKFDVISVPMINGKASALLRVDHSPIHIVDSALTQPERIEKIEQSKIMKSIISTLSDEHRQVFCYYYGFDINDDEVLLSDKKTIADISKELNLSRPRIKKIIDCANSKLVSALS